MRSSLLLVAFSLGACSAEPASETASIDDDSGRQVGSYAVDSETGEISARIHQDDGSVATMRSGDSVPIALPAGFSVYPGAEVIANTRVDHGGGKGVLLTMQSEDEPGQLSAFYRKQAEAAGVEIEVQMEAGGTAMFAGKGSNDLTFSFNVSQESGETMAQLMIGSGID